LPPGKADESTSAKIMLSDLVSEHTLLPNPKNKISGLGK
jgi:hypothetical protein